MHVHQDHVGGGFGSKFGIDRWGAYTAQVSKKAGGKPVRVMLERDAELILAGCRPSAFAKVKVGAKKDGTLTAWQSDSWGTGGPGGGGAPPMPYVVNIPNQRKQHTAIATNIGPARAWRAPNHPQGCLITMSAIEDLAAKIGMDPLQLMLKNIALTAPSEDTYHRADTYRDELMIAADLIGWKQNWHPRGQGSDTTKRGLGLAIHTWGGRGHESNCSLTIYPTGSVEIQMGTQDLGVGTRTAILIVAGDTLGLPLNQMELKIGDNQYPASGGSGGSTTIGGVSSSTRRAAVDAREQLFAKVASALNAQAGRSGSRGRNHSREVSALAQHELERCLRPAGHAADSGSGQESRPGRPDFQRRRRRGDGRCFGGHRNRHRKNEQDGLRSGLRAGHQPEDGRKPGLRRHDHGHRNHALRRKNHG